MRNSIINISIRALNFRNIWTEMVPDFLLNDTLNKSIHTKTARIQIQNFIPIGEIGVNETQMIE